MGNLYPDSPGPNEQNVVMSELVISRVERNMTIVTTPYATVYVLLGYLCYEMAQHGQHFSTVSSYCGQRGFSYNMCCYIFMKNS